MPSKPLRRSDGMELEADVNKEVKAIARAHIDSAETSFAKAINDTCGFNG